MSKTKVSVGLYGNDSERSLTNFRVLAVRDLKRDDGAVCRKRGMYLTDDFQCVHITQSQHPKVCVLILLSGMRIHFIRYEPHISSSRSFNFFFFPNSCIDFCSCEVFSSSDRGKSEA